MVVRLVYLATIDDFIFVTHLVGDAAGYDAWARKLVANDWRWDETFYQAPLYPYFLAFVYKFVGDGTVAVRVVQCLLGSAGCALLAWSAGRFISRNAGLATGLVLALYAPAIYFDGILQKTSLGFFLFATVIALTASIVSRATTWKWSVLGLVVGLLALTRENALALMPVMFVWSLIQPRRNAFSERLLSPLLLLIGFGVGVAPAAMHNHRVGGEFAITTFQFGPNFYMGNHDGATGRYVPTVPGRETPQFERSDATRLAEQAIGRSLSPKEVSDYWADRSLDYIREQPVDWMRLSAFKLALTFNRYEIPDTESIEVYCGASWWLRSIAMVGHFGLLVPLAVAGVFLTWARRRELTILYAMLIVMTGAIAVFYLFGRYRFPLVPILAIFAGGGLAGLIEQFHARQWSRLALALLAAIAVAIPCQWRINPEAELHAAQLGNLGVALALENRMDEAIPHFEQAVELHPSAPRLRQFLAQACAQTGQFASAIPHYRVALESQPADANLHFNLAVALENSGKTENALQHFREAARLNPADIDAKNAIERISRPAR